MENVMELVTMSDREKLVEQIESKLEGATEQELRLIYIAVREILRL